MCSVDGGWVELEARTTASSGKEDLLEVSLLRAGKMKDEGGIIIGPLWTPRTLSLEINGLKDVFLTGLKDAFGRSCSLSIKATSLSLNIKKTNNKETNRRSYKGKNDKSLQSVKSAFSLCVSTVLKSSHLSLRRLFASIVSQ